MFSKRNRNNWGKTLAVGRPRWWAVSWYLYVYVFTREGSKHLLSYWMSLPGRWHFGARQGVLAWTILCWASGTVCRHSVVTTRGKGAPGIEQVETGPTTAAQAEQRGAGSGSGHQGLELGSRHRHLPARLPSLCPSFPVYEVGPTTLAKYRSSERRLAKLGAQEGRGVCRAPLASMRR